MRIKRIIDQYRRDFTAEIECESCGHIQKLSGYDDRNYHDNVIPKIKCEKCEESAESLGSDYRPLMTKYPEGYQI